jgi:hypothetical protein
MYHMSITVTERSKAWIVFARSKALIVGSNPTQGLDVCVCVRSVLLSVLLGRKHQEQSLNNKRHGCCVVVVHVHSLQIRYLIAASNNERWSFLRNFGEHQIENTASNSPSVVLCVIISHRNVFTQQFPWNWFLHGSSLTLLFQFWGIMSWY